MNERDKLRFYMLTTMPNTMFNEFVAELEKHEIGPAILELWLNDLEDKERRIEKLENDSYFRSSEWDFIC